MSTVADATTAFESPRVNLFSPPPQTPNGVVLRALAQDKHEGLWLAVRVRWVALVIIAIFLAFNISDWRAAAYYEVLLAGFALIGWAQLRIGRVGRSRAELLLIFCDLALMTFALLVPNPFHDGDIPLAMQYRFGNFPYFYVLLAGATLGYHWRTILMVGALTSVLWLAGMAWILYQPISRPEWAEAIRAALAGRPDLIRYLDPAVVDVSARIQEVITFLIVAGTLALACWRSNRLLLKHAGVERERANLARYFSPNVVEELSRNDEPLKQVRTQNVAVLFADLVEFTAYSDSRRPHEVIATLREFHNRMEREVFRYNGTLDKYLGDGLMATFGTPLTGTDDAGNALRCARAMSEAVKALNVARAARGEAPVRAGFGLHYGDAILGDIGANRLEFAVIGRTVNIAARLEGMTRDLGSELLVSDALVRRAVTEPAASEADLAGLQRLEPRMIRGIAEPIVLWSA